MSLFVLLGCTDFNFAEEWQLDRLRLLAIRAEPAEPRPGEFVTFTSLSYVPSGLEWSALWLACVDGDTEGCTLDPALVDQLDNTDEMTEAELAVLFAALQAGGLVGIEPGMALGWVAPADALDDLDEAGRLEGKSATVTVSLTAGEDNELTLKAIPVSEATTPNHNPDLLPITFDGAAIDATATVTVDAGNAIDLSVTLAGALETYTYVTTEGLSETRTEELSFRWYTSGGTLGTGFDTGVSPPSFGEDEGLTTSDEGWVTPAEPGDYRLDVVVLDGRGGMGWQSVVVTVR